MPFDHESFIAGVQVGRRLKVADAQRKLPPKPPVPYGWGIITEAGLSIVSEAEVPIITENEPEV